MMNFENARKFIYQNARPLDIARWKYFFEGGTDEDVLTALAEYQNGDGGFGSALEPDCWNPNSSPVQTWVATEMIKEINLEDKSHPIVEGILRYLTSGKDFDGHTWLNTIASNNDYPHAPWWDYSPDQGRSYNPAACLVGFIIKFAENGSDAFKMACKLALEAFDYFKKNYPMDSMHTAACFVGLYEAIKESGITGLVDLDEYKALLNGQIQRLITYDTSKWAVDYVCKPSLFIKSKTSDFYTGNEKICEVECAFIGNTQEQNGTWNITWEWGGYPEQWFISKNWWKSDVIIKNIRFIKEIKELNFAEVLYD